MKKQTTGSTSIAAKPKTKAAKAQSFVRVRREISRVKKQLNFHFGCCCHCGDHSLRPRNNQEIGCITCGRVAEGIPRTREEVPHAWELLDKWLKANNYELIDFVFGGSYNHGGKINVWEITYE